jgi:hypothetical protein
MRRVNTITIPPFAYPGIFFLPRIGFSRIKPDILIKIRENSIICPISGIELFLSSALMPT